MSTLRSPGPTVLGTGGLGFIGAHAVAALSCAGYPVVILDNLANSERSVLADLQTLCDFPLTFVEGDVRDADALDALLAQQKPPRACTAPA